MNEPRNGNDLQIGLLDRLATGDLDGPSRCELFAQLDREPALWRRCALALLEARELERALGDWKAEARDRGTALPEPASRLAKGAPLWDDLPRPSGAEDGLGRPSYAETSDSLPVRLGDRQGRPFRIPAKRSRGEWAALAASVLIAFGLGMTVRGTGIAPQAILQTVPDSAHSAPPAKRSAQDSALVAAAGQALSHEDDAGRNDAGQSTPESAERLPAYVRSQLERRGYRVDSRHGVVPVSLPDGRRVMLPVDQLQFSYVGRQSY
jgi:hypothetical protein